jgi:hypothetical protein
VSGECVRGTPAAEPKLGSGLQASSFKEAALGFVVLRGYSTMMMPAIPTSPLSPWKRQKYG